ncbi:MAG: hypothetical protein JNL03_02520 [Prolixibacteraceae bacterium]|nr:hypothetical protein [Prolixibacteraceae bacterium]
MAKAFSDMKERTLKLFPVEISAGWDKHAFPEITREILVRAISNGGCGEMS